MDALKPGGFLIYSTCTFNTSENEENVTWMIKEFGLQQFPITIAPNWGITPSAFLENAYRFYPHKVKGEGLFMCCLQKPGADEENIRSEKFSPLSRAVQNELYQWIQPETPMEFVQEGNMYIGLSLNIVPDYLYLKRKLKLAQSGIKMGEIMKGQLIPDHALALSVDLCSQVKRQELNLEDAKRFLRKDVIAATSFQETGWALVTYQNHGLGWVKVLPNRVNNYFPTNWRVIKEI
jgi:NOL1/NOP2/fmu family ribosome biogenesis protein